ncbi:hypothetical protein D9M68_929540 [compost metagenome]
MVGAVVPVGFVLAGEGAFGGGVARHLEGGGFGTLLSEQGFPFGVGFLYGRGHEEQLISIVEAQSGGKPA